jgi:hypothetical protein
MGSSLVQRSGSRVRLRVYFRAPSISSVATIVVRTAPCPLLREDSVRYRRAGVCHRYIDRRLLLLPLRSLRLHTYISGRTHQSTYSPAFCSSLSTLHSLEAAIPSSTYAQWLPSSFSWPQQPLQRLFPHQFNWRPAPLPMSRRPQRHRVCLPA